MSSVHAGALVTNRECKWLPVAKSDKASASGARIKGSRSQTEKGTMPVLRDLFPEPKGNCIITVTAAKRATELVYSKLTSGPGIALQ